MKVIYLKKSILISILIFISILSTILITYNVVNNSHEDIDNIDTELRSELDSLTDGCDDSDCEAKLKFLLEQYEKKKIIALTFDDGPSKYTDELIDGLKKRNVPATFFILGQSAESRISTLQFAYDAGNEIAIHSYVHKLFTRLKDEEILEQIDKTRTIISSITGEEPKLIRVPYGSINNRVQKLLDNNQLTDVLWSVDSKDWKFKNVDKTYKYVMKYVKGNDIILMHDAYKQSVDAAFKIVDELQSKGYTFVTVSEFLKIKELAQK